MLWYLVSSVFCEQTITGTNNNQENVLWNSQGTPYLYPLNVQTQQPTVNPRLISNQLFARYPNLISEGVSDMTPFWGQFLAHDIVLTMKGSDTQVFSYPRCDRRFDASCVNTTITIARALRSGM
jgi:alpha-acetolactate decarboxylase